MTAEQVLRFALVKMKERLSYRRLQANEIIDHYLVGVADSIGLRGFCLVGSEPVTEFTTLQENIKRVRPQTWEAINDLVVGYAYNQGVEDGQRVRIDTTGVPANIHHPTDSQQLWDSVRVLARILQRVETDVARLRGTGHDHRRAAKRLFYSRRRVHSGGGRNPVGLRGEDVPAGEKVLSIFEPHTDIIKKGQREIIYRHKAGDFGSRLRGPVHRRQKQLDSRLYY